MITEPKPALFSQFLQNPAENELLTSILRRRGWQDACDLNFLLCDSLRMLHSPFLLHDMQRAVKRCQKAIKNQEKIAIISDHDLDGIASVVILLEGLQTYSLQPRWFHTDTQRSHFNKIQALRDVKKEGCSLLFLLDGGSHLPLHRDYEDGDIIIFDHHIPSHPPPQCNAFVNPHLANYPYKEICSALITAKFLWALALSYTPIFEQQNLLVFSNLQKNSTFFQYATSKNGVIEERGLLEKVDKNFYEKFNNIYYFGNKEQRYLAQCLPRNAQDLAQIFCSYYPQFRSLQLSDLEEEKSFPRGQTPLHTLNLIHQEVTTQQFSLDKHYTKALDLVALATLSDMMPLHNENRIVVKKGLQTLKLQLRTGLRQLLIHEGILSLNYDSLFFMRRVNPLLNAAGKLGKPHLSTLLLLTNEAQQARDYAKTLEKLSKERRVFCRQIWLSLYVAAKESYHKCYKKMIILYEERLRSGFSGLLALQLCRSFATPVILAYPDQDGGINASIRSNGLLDIGIYSKKIRTLGGSFGGHRYAGGCSLSKKGWLAFEQHCYRISEHLVLEKLQQEENFEVDLELITLTNLLKIIDILAPFGYQNSPPLFICRALRVIAIKPFGKGNNHLNLTLEKGGQRWRACWWNALEKNTLQISDKVDLSFHLQKNLEEQFMQPRIDIKDVQKVNL